MEINKVFTIYKTQNRHGYYTFFVNIVKSTVFKKIHNKDTEYKNIIYDKEFIIIYENPILEKYATLYCTRDTNDTNRFFVGINFNTSIYAYALTGLFLYFDNDNVADIIIIPEIVKEYSGRNGIILSDKTFLHNQTLVFLDKHHQLNTFRITVCCFDYCDTLIGKHTDYTDINNDYMLHCNRWLVFNNNIMIDLGSVKVESDKLKYNMYKILSDVESFIKDNPTIMEEKYGDDYPRHCIKCNEITCITKYYNKINECSTIISNLGNSYCHSCSIRFSLSKKSWICSKLVNNDNFCCANLDTNYNCNKNHSNKKLAYIMNYTGKKPYKNDYELFSVS